MSIDLCALSLLVCGIVLVFASRGIQSTPPTSGNIRIFRALAVDTVSYRTGLICMTGCRVTWQC